MEGDFFTILLGLILGFVLVRFVINFFLDMPSDEELTGTLVSRSKGCKLHRWVYEVGSKRLVCSVCKQKPSND